MGLGVRSGDWTSGVRRGSKKVTHRHDQSTPATSRRGGEIGASGYIALGGEGYYSPRQGDGSIYGSKRRIIMVSSVYDC